MSMKYLETKNIEISSNKTFKDSLELSSKDKSEIYKDFSNFVFSNFQEEYLSDRLFNFFNKKLGFDSYTNKKQFYAHYFKTAAIYNKIANNYKIGDFSYMQIFDKSYPYKGLDSIEAKEQFFNIYHEFTTKNEKLYTFKEKLLKNINLSINYHNLDLIKSMRQVIRVYYAILAKRVRKALRENRLELDATKKNTVYYKPKQRKEDTSTKLAEVSNKALQQSSIFDYLNI